MGDFVAERSFAVVERNATLMRPLSAVEHLAAWIEEAVAQRAAREAAERERDEALERERRWQDGFEQRLAAAESVIVEAKAALSASTEREAGLREVAETALSRWKWDIAGPEAVPTRISLDEIDKLRDRLASLAAPEGGTSRPTPPEWTNGE